VVQGQVEKGEVAGLIGKRDVLRFARKVGDLRVRGFSYGLVTHAFGRLDPEDRTTEGLGQGRGESPDARAQIEHLESPAGRCPPSEGLQPPLAVLRRHGPALGVDSMEPLVVVHPPHAWSVATRLLR
jgi:hypothetical protein